MKNLLYIVWSSKNDLGIPIIDEQHKGIVSVINSLYYFMQRGEGEDELLHIIDMLEYYIKVHFKTEEGIIKKAGFPEYEKHSLMHDEFLKKLQKIKSEITTINEPEGLLKSLKIWWIEHIKNEDLKFVSFVKDTADR